MRVVAFALAIGLLPAGALAQANVPDGDRFQMERRGNEIIRLDRQTGAISTCTDQNGALDCRSSADERAALQAEIDRLAGEVDRLRAQVAGKEPETGVSKDGKSVTLKLPSEQEVQGAVDFLNDLLRRAVDAVRDLLGERA
ncbi:hypothetical protein [Terrihabitans sp. B22-R8]|uniref:hypothetical protein n=1 Tax=Terrihabitans sp. B22-R8 TaxID=3425128 RepID=UPI00403C750A